MASSLGFERSSPRPRSGHQLGSPDREARVAHQERLRRGHDVQVVLGRWVCPRTNSRDRSVSKDYKVASFAEQFGYANHAFGEAVVSEKLVLEYVGSEKVAELVDDFIDHSSGRLSRRITPSGRKKLLREKKEDLQAFLKKSQTGATARDLELEAPIRKRIDDNPKTGVTSLLLSHADRAIKNQILDDLDVLNAGLVEVELIPNPGKGLTFDDLSLKIAVFTLAEEYRHDPTIELVRPLIPMGNVVFQRLGAHQISE